MLLLRMKKIMFGCIQSTLNLSICIFKQFQGGQGTSRISRILSW